MNIDDPNTQSLSASVGFLLPNPANPVLPNHSDSFDQQPSSSVSSFSHPPVVTVEDKNPTYPVGLNVDHHSQSPGDNQPSLSNHSGTEFDDLSYEFTSDHGSSEHHLDEDEFEFEFVTDSDSSAQ